MATPNFQQLTPVQRQRPWKPFPSSVLIPLVTLLLPLVVSLPANDKSSTVVDGDVIKGQTNDVFLRVSMAKSMLAKKRVKRGWSINSLNLLWEMEEQQRRDAARAHNKELHLAKVCPATCWGHFGPWSPCSVTCGSSGLQHSYRNVTPSSECSAWLRKHGCPGSKLRTRACNRRCENGATLGEKNCLCPPGFNGACCDKVISCGDPGAPENGYAENFDFTYGKNVTYSCRHGYRLRGDVSRNCDGSGKWSGAVPYCAIVMCVRPPRLENGWIELPTGSAFGSAAEHGCVAGFYLRGVRIRTCSVDGGWSGTPPVCKAIRCQRPFPPTGGFVRLSKVGPGRVPYGGLAVYSCDVTRVLHGPRVRRCGTMEGPLGFWSGHRPACRPKKFCPVPTAPLNAGLHCSADVSKNGEQCYVHCHHGYAHASPENNFIECNVNTNWTWTRQNDSSPICLEVFTPEISIQATATYGVQDCSILTTRETVILQAEFSQILGAQRICRDDGTTLMDCKITQVTMRCGDWRLQTFPSKLVSQEVIMTFNLTTEHQSLTKVNCPTLCSNDTDDCDSRRCMSAYNEKATSTLLRHVHALHQLFSVEKNKKAKYITKGNTYSPRATLAVGRMILLPKGHVKVSSVVFACEQSTVIARSICGR